ncbi:type II secretion system F family protein [Paenibacillus sp. 1A_MP2]|uniref:type II secretion system F family protein n=1 Tax=Paenibacillus sp. 1A_MP2 TaxID=3457495 RepID=UPI003FCCAB65
MMTGGGIVAGVLAAANGGSFVIAGSIAAFVVWGIYKYQEGSYEIKYRKNGKIAVEYLNGIVSAGGTLEDWVGEVIPKLSGSLRTEFEIGHANYERNIPITKFLERLIKNCPDSSLGLIWSGLLREIRQAGDMKTFVEESLKDLQNQERINRVMGQIRKNGAQMMVWVCVLPGTLYALFSDVLKEILTKHPYTNIVLFALLAGYGFILWWGMRISQGARK